ncbi:MAG: carboxypeptidase-like regulatory domain-containing protein [Daejeonella sp.]
MKKSLLLLVMSSLLFITSAVAQEKMVTGTVTDNDKLTLPGVSVKIKGTATGVSTDANGKYSIRVNQGSVLQFTFIGSMPKEITVGAQDVINVTLIADTRSLDEVVIVGYGTQKKATLTGAISTVDVDKVLGSRPTTMLFVPCKEQCLA